MSCIKTRWAFFCLFGKNATILQHVGKGEIMGVTSGTLLKRGQVWWWKYQLDGDTKWESLKVKAKRDAECVRQQL